jgi:ubiquinone/menaquinone biosynthesis C-methylase UbiE
LTDLERLISGRFDELAATPMFCRDVAPDDFELKAALEWLGDVRSHVVLDLGCARDVKPLSAFGARVVGVDRSWQLLHTAPKNAGGSPFVLSTATRLPFADSTYDGVLCIEVIEHIPELEAALCEIARVLKPGGRAIIIDKNPVGVGTTASIQTGSTRRRWSGRHPGPCGGSCEATSPAWRFAI